MDPTPNLVLQNIVLLFSAALIISVLFRYLWAPTILGYLFTGILIGPHLLGLFSQEQVEPLAEIGLVLLLFVVGLELSPRFFTQLGPNLLLASTLQIGGVLAAAALVLLLFTPLSFVAVFLISFTVAMTSTPIVLKHLSDRGATSGLVGRLTTGISIVQDISAIVLMLFLPLLVTTEEGAAWHGQLLPFLGGIMAMVAGILVVRRLLPVVLEKIVRPGGRELLLMFAVVLVLASAWAADALGWSMALGALIVGLLLSEADERHQLAAEILPYRDIFNALFFISIGMLLNLDTVIDHWPILVAAVLATLFLKTAIASAAVSFAGWPIRPSLYVGIGLFAISEFGYVLIREAGGLGLLSSETVDAVVAYIIGTMFVGALLLPASEYLISLMERLNLIKDQAVPVDEALAPHPALAHHVIIIGYGLNGRNCAKVLSATRIPYCVVEMNPQLVQTAREEGVEVVVGDAARAYILDRAGLSTARALVVAINDPPATRRIVARARSLRPNLFILARTRFVAEIDELYEAGASRVIPEEFETSLEIAAHVLKELDVPDNVVEGQLAAVRAGGYGMLRGKPTTRAAAAELMEVFQLTATRTHYIAEGAAAAERTIADLDLRRRTGVSILAVVRGNSPVTNPPPHFRVRVGDVLVLVGSHAQLESARDVLQNGPSADDLPPAQHEQSAVVPGKQELS
ncbi:MAG: cation:proton antiporter [Candidatus Hydrogenedentales bacterium]